MSHATCGKCMGNRFNRVTGEVCAACDGAGVIVPETEYLPDECQPDIVLEHSEKKLDVCLVIGYDAGGNFYFQGSTQDRPEVVYLLEKAKELALRAKEMYTEIIENDDTFRTIDP